MLIIFVIIALDLLIGYVLLLPSISTIGHKLCYCNNTRTGCSIWSPGILCYPAVALLHFLTFLTFMMLTTILWMMVSMLHSMFVGVQAAVGTFQWWGQVRGAPCTADRLSVPFGQSRARALARAPAAPRPSVPRHRHRSRSANAGGRCGRWRWAGVVQRRGACIAAASALSRRFGLWSPVHCRWPMGSSPGKGGGRGVLKERDFFFVFFAKDSP